MSLPEQQQQQYRVQLSYDEVKILKECNRDSFYFRCLPLMGVLSGGVLIAQKSGHLKGGSKAGLIPHYIGAAFFGYIIGKFSYKAKCMEKILSRIPDSNLAETVKNNHLHRHSMIEKPPRPSNTSDQPASLLKTSLMDDSPPDFQAHNEGLDSYNTVTESLLPYKEDSSIESPSIYQSYDDLRKENRKEYHSRLQERYRKHAEEAVESSSLESASLQAPSQIPSKGPKKAKTNAYGDSWEE